MAVKTLKCLTCGGDLKFNPTLQKFKCEWCDAEFAEKDLGDGSSEASSVSEAIQSVESMDNPDIKVYRCSYCGAEVVTDAVTAATFCVYCQRPVTVGSQLSGEFKPSKLIPFKNTKDEALSAFKNYLKGKRFLPNAYKDDQNIEKLSGLYIPFWLYNGDVGFEVRGEGDIVTTSEKNGVQETKTEIYGIAREGVIKIKRIPVDASSKTPDDVMDSIEPFDFSQLTNFSTNYLSGFLAERYDEDSTKSYERAKVRFEGSAENTVKKSLDKYSEVRRKVDKKRVDNVKSIYALLPIWILYSQFQNKKYIYAMNGQTGKITGDLPVDGGKIAGYSLVVYIISCLIGGIVGAIAGFTAVGVIIGIIVASVIVFGELKKHKPVAKAEHADYYIRDGDLKMKVTEDKYIKTTVTKSNNN